MDHAYRDDVLTMDVLLRDGYPGRGCLAVIPEVWGRRWAARSGLKMGVWSPVDVVAPWSVEAVLKSGAGSCAVGPSLLP